MSTQLKNILELLATVLFAILFILVAVVISYNAAQIMFDLIISSFRITIIDATTFVIPYVSASLFVLFGAWAIKKCSSAQSRSFLPLLFASASPVVIMIIGNFY